MRLKQCANPIKMTLSSYLQRSSQNFKRGVEVQTVNDAEITAASNQFSKKTKIMATKKMTIWNFHQWRRLMFDPISTNVPLLYSLKTNDNGLKCTRHYWLLLSFEKEMKKKKKKSNKLSASRNWHLKCYC